MKSLSIAFLATSLASAVLASSASAQSRPFAPALPCGEVANFVSLNGATVVRTGPGTFDRFVAAQRYCTRHEVAKPAWVVSADNPQCFIGYTCEPVYGRSIR